MAIVPFIEYKLTFFFASSISLHLCFNSSHFSISAHNRYSMNLYKLEVHINVFLWHLLLMRMHRSCGFKEEFPCLNATWEMLS